ncbi:alpha/beta fold hydrolase [Fervidobacterium thailandense]|uniref:ABC transporter permease n=1 Tax=Fervidobacterium thailandense TaxID=1008305 RepID=A0A1E3G0E4_9BACT|nr:alpha/beta fold hydrolase [Fervidobacterium thailandense]ODN29721.1 ABC transporter permease [Fervidobacterium thailandense]
MVWVVLAVLPFLLIKNAFVITILTLVGIYALASLGLNIIMGYAGQISIGHAAFMSIGAYTSTLLVMNYNVPVTIGVLAGGLLAFLFGLLIGFPALRLSGFYLAIATMGFVVAVEQLVGALDSITGGHAGIRGIKFPYLFNSDVEKYLLVLAFLYISYVAAQRFVNSKTGRAWMAVRENETVASVVGVNPAKYKLLAFAFGSMLAGFAGALYAHVTGFIAPSVFGLGKSLDLLAISVIGGMASLDGPFYGALVYEALPFFFSRTNLSLSIVFGAILIFVVLFMPLGISFYISQLRFNYLNAIIAFLKKSRRPYGKFLDTKFGKIHYVQYGQGKTPIVLLHGNFASARFFEPFLRLLPNGFTAYAFDLPNFGFSDRMAGVTIDKYAEVVDEFVNKLGLEKFILLGHSLGGSVAIAYATKHQDRLLKLVLVDPGPIDGLYVPDEGIRLLQKYKYNPHLIKKSLMFNVPTYDDERFFDKVTSDALRIPKEAIREVAEALRNYNYTDKASGVNIPVEVIFGDKDVILSLWQMQKTAAAFPRGRLHILKDVGHSPVVEAPKEVFRIILENQ